MTTGVSITNLRKHISALEKNTPKKTALVSCDMQGKVLEESTYLELSRRIDFAAHYLREAGLTYGDRVALAFKNSPELLILSWAAWSCGIVTVPLDVKRDTGEQYQYKISLNKAKVLIAQKGFLADADRAYLRDVEIKELSEFPAISGPGFDWESGLSHQALVLFTSGTTGHPRGAKLSLLNLIVNAQGIREWLHITEEDRFLVQLPLHHINSTTFCLSTLLAGGTIAIPPAYSNSNFWRQAATTHATITSIVQSILFDQLSREEEYDAVKKDVKLNRIQIGSAPVIAQTVQEFRQKYHIPLYQGYGHTETALRVTGVPIGLPADLYEKLIEQNSIGKAMAWADVQVADEKGNILDEGKDGELVVKGPAVMEGYVGNEPAFRNEYFLTGDIGLYRLIEGERYFFLTGRKKEIIIKGGVNVSPVAVENQLRKIGSDIDQVYVVAVPDERYGEEIAAAVCWKKDTDEKSAMRRLKFTLLSGVPHVSAFETPRYVTTYPASELPMTSTGKVQRTVLKDKIPFAQFESLHTLLKTPSYQFSILDIQSPHVSASHKLYNHCWQPLEMDENTYKKDIGRQFILIALDNAGKLAGQIAFIRTDLTSEELLHTTYAQLLTPDVTNRNGRAVICVSICSADFQPKLIPSVGHIPDDAAVKKYLQDGLDPVMRFHQKPKGGLKEGASLIGLIPKGRPEDISALGYNMLLKYSAPSHGVGITLDAPISNQLIEAVLRIAKDVGIKDVYAYSRPGGLASYMAK